MYNSGKKYSLLLRGVCIIHRLTLCHIFSLMSKTTTLCHIFSLMSKTTTLCHIFSLMSKTTTLCHTFSLMSKTTTLCHIFSLMSKTTSVEKHSVYNQTILKHNYVCLVNFNKVHHYVCSMDVIFRFFGTQSILYMLLTEISGI